MANSHATLSTHFNLIITIFSHASPPASLTTLPDLPLPSTVTLHSSSQLSPRVLQQIYTLPPSTEASTFRRVPALIAYERTHAVELVLQPWYFPTVPSTRHLTLAVFDLDSTLIDQEIIDELARSTGMLPAVAAITERTMRGELDFTESLKSRVALLKGTPTDVWEAVRERMTLAEGSRELCRGLGKLGTKMAVLSGGFVQIAEWVKGELGLHVAEANHLSTSPPTAAYPYPHLSGFLSPTHPIVTAAAKRLHLVSLATTYASSDGGTTEMADVGLQLVSKAKFANVLAVGDGANDLEMLGAVGDGGGLGVAFKAKEKVQESAPNRLNSRSLVDLLYLLGYDEEEIQALVVE